MYFVKEKINCKVNIRKLTVNIIQEKEINYYYYYYYYYQF